MALQKLVAVFAVILLINKGCHSRNSGCGNAALNTRIVGGQTAVPGSWPWQIVFKNADFFFCGGSVINNQWLLTAAHCAPSIDPDTTSVHLGIFYLNSFNPGEVIRSVAEVHCNPGYNSQTYNNDICLVKMSAPVNFTEFIQPICLADENSTFYDELSVWVTGFGITSLGAVADTLQEVSVPIIGNNRCHCYNQAYSTVTDNMMCAGVEAGGKDSCQGDSGGPLVANIGGTWVQGGVVSFGAGCGVALLPGVYARVSQYKQWITNTVTGPPPGFVSFTSPGINFDDFFTCPPPPPPTPTSFPTTTDDSVFGSGENLGHFTHLTALSVLGLFLHFFISSGGM
ncbi:serine protease 27-like [Nothobranchius furzeri]|uniref:Serine protease 27-like n=1 Tax=Nothobranchius furzeri TaxID=105023 RepID=A0A8C6L519_NOTFU|nr:serine protease 27-like [Nothobranchius furzeri]